MIRSLRDREAEKLFQDQFSKKYQSLERIARRKLTMLDEAETLEDIAALPGNRLEALKGSLKGDRESQAYHSDQRPISHLFRVDEGRLSTSKLQTTTRRFMPKFLHPFIQERSSERRCWCH